MKCFSGAHTSWNCHRQNVVVPTNYCYTDWRAPTPWETERESGNGGEEKKGVEGGAGEEIRTRCSVGNVLILGSIDGGAHILSHFAKAERGTDGDSNLIAKKNSGRNGC
jgi:hypothetical protein